MSSLSLNPDVVCSPHQTMYVWLCMCLYVCGYTTVPSRLTVYVGLSLHVPSISVSLCLCVCIWLCGVLTVAPTIAGIRVLWDTLYTSVPHDPGEFRGVPDWGRQPTVTCPLHTTPAHLHRCTGVQVYRYVIYRCTVIPGSHTAHPKQTYYLYYNQNCRI